MTVAAFKAGHPSLDDLSGAHRDADAVRPCVDAAPAIEGDESLSKHT
jgi:hypothetical protein